MLLSAIGAKILTLMFVIIEVIIEGLEDKIKKLEDSLR
jgi:hypothetical protein